MYHNISNIEIRYNNIYNTVIYLIIFLVITTCACAHAHTRTREYYILEESRKSVTMKIGEPSYSTGNPVVDNFNATTQSHKEGSIPVLENRYQPNVYTEKHGIYSYIVGPNGIEKIIVNMVGLYITDHDKSQRYGGFRLNNGLNVALREEALRFPRSGGSIELEFIIDNAGLSFYLEGDYTNLGTDYTFVSGNGYAGISSFTDNQAEGLYSVRYKINVAPAREYTNREVLACHWTCSWETCFYGTFNLVIVQEAATDEDRPVYIG